MRSLPRCTKRDSRRKFDVNETVLVVDDEERIRSALRGILSDEGFRVVDTGHAPGVMDLIARESPAIVLLDVWMPEMDGIELLRRIKSEQPRVPVIMISGHANIQSAVAATKLGAADFIQKPFSVSGLLASIARALEGDSAGPDPSNPRGLSARGPRRRPQSNPRRRDPAANRRAIDRDGRAGASHRTQDRRHTASRAAGIWNRIHIARRRDCYSRPLRERHRHRLQHHADQRRPLGPHRRTSAVGAARVWNHQPPDQDRRRSPRARRLGARVLQTDW